MDELGLQEAVEIANAIIEHGSIAVVEAEIREDTMLAASHMRKLADAIIKLGGGTVRSRTTTIKRMPPLVG